MQESENIATRVYTPTEVAGVLGLKDGMMRRYLAAYEVVVRPLPRQEGRANAPRLIPQTALEALQAARTLVLEQPGQISVEDALRQVSGVVLKRMSTDLETLPPNASWDELTTFVQACARERDELVISETVQRVQQPLLELVAEQREALEEQSKNIAALHEDVRALKGLLTVRESAPATSTPQPFWARLFGRRARS